VKFVTNTCVRLPPKGLRARASPAIPGPREPLEILQTIAAQRIQHHKALEYLAS
jgi:hypothetical protein